MAAGLTAAAYALPSASSEIAQCMFQTLATNLTVNASRLALMRLAGSPPLANISCPSIVTIFGVAWDIAGQLSKQVGGPAKWRMVCNVI